MNDKKIEEILNRVYDDLNLVVRNSEFEDFIKDYISDHLDSYEGIEVCIGDLSITLCEEDNVNGCVFMATAQSEKFILRFPDEASETFDYLNEDVGMVVNPFDKPDAFVYCMVEYAVRNMLDKSAYIENNQDEEVVLTKKIINTIKKDLDIESFELSNLESVENKTTNSTKKETKSQEGDR